MKHPRANDRWGFHLVFVAGALLALCGSCNDSGGKYPDPIPPDTAPPPSLFYGGTSYPAGVSPGPLATGDVDGDGLADVVTLSRTMEEVRILRNKGNGILADPVAIPVGLLPDDVVLADLNKDGKPDLAIAGHNGSGNVAVLLNKGAGVFAAPVNYKTSPGSASLTSGFLTDGGFRDLVITNDPSTNTTGPSLGTVTVLLNRGDGTFGDALVHDVGRSPRGAAITDLNGDGTNDVAVVNSADGEVSVLLNRRSGMFEPDIPMVAAVGYTSIAAVDVLNERTDLVLGGEPGIGVFADVVSTRFGLPRRYAAGFDVTGFAFADRDGDERPEIYLVRRGDLIGFLQSFGRSPLLLDYSDSALPAGEEIVSIESADLDGDGKMDLVTANQASDDVTVVLNRDLDGPGYVSTSINAASSMAAAELDEDELADLVMTNGTDKLAVNFSNNPGGNWGDPLPLIDGGPGASFVAAGDLNGDGQKDLAVVNGREIGTVSILLNKGASSHAFAPPVPVVAAAHYGPGGGPQSAAIGDVNGDGRNDLVVANHPQSGAAGDVSVLINAGGGAFAPPVEYVVLPDLQSVPSEDLDDAGVILADFNDDGRLDIALGVWGVNLLINKGDGSFLPVVRYGMGTVAGAALAAGDINEDGHTDLAFAQPGWVGVLLNDGKGKLKKPVRQNIAGGARLALADFDGDGHTDMAVAGRRGAAGGLTVLANDGKGSFRVMIKRAAGPTCCLVAGHIGSNDHKVDVAVGSLTSPSQVFIYWNRTP